MNHLHTIAQCTSPGCAWADDGPDPDRAAHLHTTSKARGHVPHPTVTRTHPTTHCHREGCHR